MKKICILFGFSVLFLSSCNNDKKNDGEEKNTNETEVQPKKNFPEFNEDSAYTFIEKQVSFGPRIPATKSWERCADYLFSKLKSYCPNTELQSTEVKAYNGKMLPCKNILAYISPEKKKRILLCSHWDTRPWADQEPNKASQSKTLDGANDGPSGVAVILELARAFAQQNPEVGIDIVFFDVEDYGAPEWEPNRDDNFYCLGTQYWATNYPKEKTKPVYGVLLDMVGARGSRFMMEGKSLQYANDAVQKIWAEANALGYSNLFISQQTAGIIDDHIHINQTAKIPTLDIVDYDMVREKGFGSYWHTTADNMSIIDKATLKAVGSTLMSVIYKEK